MEGLKRVLRGIYGTTYRGREERKEQEQLQREERRWQAEKERHDWERDVRKVGLLQAAGGGIETPTIQIQPQTQSLAQGRPLEAGEIRETTLPKPAGWGEVSEGSPLVPSDPTDPMAEFQKTIDNIETVQKKATQESINETRAIGNDIDRGLKILKANEREPSPWKIDPQKIFATEDMRQLFPELERLSAESKKKASQALSTFLLATKDPRIPREDVYAVMAEMSPYFSDKGNKILENNVNRMYDRADDIAMQEIEKKELRGQMVYFKELTKEGRGGPILQGLTARTTRSKLTPEEEEDFQAFWNGTNFTALSVYGDKGKAKYKELDANFKNKFDRFFQKEEKAKEFAPQAKSLVHPKTGKRKWFDMSKTEDIEAAQREGYEPYEKLEKPGEEKVSRENKWLSNYGKRYAVSNIYGESLLTEESAKAAWADFKKQIPALKTQGYDIDYLTTQMRSLYGEEILKSEKLAPDTQKLHDQATEAIKLQPKRKEEIKKQYKEMTGQEYR